MAAARVTVGRDAGGGEEGGGLDAAKTCPGPGRRKRTDDCDGGGDENAKEKKTTGILSLGMEENPHTKYVGPGDAARNDGEDNVCWKGPLLSSAGSCWSPGPDLLGSAFMSVQPVLQFVSGTCTQLRRSCAFSVFHPDWRLRG